MDCGPASLKSLLEGFGIPVSYGRLREACQTDVDGTSIDTIEEIACDLGLAAEQVMVPPDHLVLPSADMLPAMVVVRLPSGFTHFIVVWRLHGRWVQVMDPAAGRTWMTTTRFLEQVYVHSQPVPVAGYREWSTSEDFLRPLRDRHRRLGCLRELASRTEQAASDPSWQVMASLDAATTMVESLRRAGGIARGQQAAKAITFFFDEWQKTHDPKLMPERCWRALPTERRSSEGEEQILLRGAVALRVEGLYADA